MVDLPTLLQYTKNIGASDLHLSAGADPMVRIHGETRRLEIEGFDLHLPSAVRSVIYGFLTEGQKKILEADWELDCAMQLGEDARFRANIFLQQRGIGGVFRVIPTEIPSAEKLGLPAVVKDLGSLQRGLVLITGPTGSGKSTTLAAIIDYINRNRRGHIITIEDPIEFVHQQKKCMVNQRQVRRHTKAFANALKSALREDPDVILVGEMRDTETIALAIEAAETGHLVFGTLHTSSAAQTVDRVINVFPAGRQQQVRTMLAESLQAVVAQVLLKKRSGGRVAAHEILLITSGARSMIREEKTFQLPSILQTGHRWGMVTLRASIEKLVRNGQVEARVAEEMISSLDMDEEDENKEERPRVSISTRYSPGSSGSSGSSRPKKPEERPKTLPTGAPIRDKRESTPPPVPKATKPVYARSSQLPKGRRHKGEVVFVLGGGQQGADSEPGATGPMGPGGKPRDVGPPILIGRGARTESDRLAAAPPDVTDGEITKLFKNVSVKGARKQALDGNPSQRIPQLSIGAGAPTPAPTPSPKPAPAAAKTSDDGLDEGAGKEAAAAARPASGVEARRGVKILVEHDPFQLGGLDDDDYEDEDDDAFGDPNSVTELELELSPEVLKQLEATRAKAEANPGKKRAKPRKGGGKDKRGGGRS